MITADDGPALRAELFPGSSAYVDRDWVDLRASATLPALIVGPDAALRRADGPMVRSPDGIEPDVVAALVFGAVAREAAAAVEEVEGSRVEVVGTGVVASAVRGLIGPRAVAGQGPGGSARPVAVVDTTGDPDTIRQATERVADLGTLVLAGEPLGRPFQIDLYPHIHLRGLVLVATGLPLHSGPPDPPADGGCHSLAQLFEESLREIAPDTPLPADGLWYRVSGSSAAVRP